MATAREELSPLVESCNAWCEHDVIFFEEAEAAGLTAGVVASKPPLQDVPGDGEVDALLPELVGVLAEGGAGLVLVLLLHVVDMPIVPLPEGAL